MLHPEEDHHLLAPDDLPEHIAGSHGKLLSQAIAEAGGLATARRKADERGYDLGEDATPVTTAYAVWHDDVHGGEREADAEVTG